jgi:hypothetical protein
VVSRSAGGIQHRPSAEPFPQRVKERLLSS